MYLLSRDLCDSIYRWLSLLVSWLKWVFFNVWKKYTQLHLSIYHNGIYDYQPATVQTCCHSWWNKYVIILIVMKYVTVLQLLLVYFWFLLLSAGIGQPWLLKHAFNQPDKPAWSLNCPLSSSVSFLQGQRLTCYGDRCLSCYTLFSFCFHRYLFFHFLNTLTRSPLQCMISDVCLT